MSNYSPVYVIRGSGVYTSSNTINLNILNRIIHLGLTQIAKHTEGIKNLFPYLSPIGIKINTLSGKKLSTRPETAITLARSLIKNGIREQDIIIWDRTNRELKEAGYKLNNDRKKLKIFATDTKGIGYDNRLVSHLNIGSLFSSIQSRLTSFSISLAILKDHGLAGITAGLKNYFGAIHNPNKYHDFNCDPFVAELFDTALIKKKHRLSVLDCLSVQFHRGPAFHSQWNKNYESLIFSLDPVAADFVGWQIIEKMRAKHGLPTLKEEKREPTYLYTAEKMGLGNANLKKIKVIEEEI